MNPFLYAKCLKNHNMKEYNKMCNDNEIYGIYRVGFDNWIDSLKDGSET